MFQDPRCYFFPVHFRLLHSDLDGFLDGFADGTALFWDQYRKKNTVLHSNLFLHAYNVPRDQQKWPMTVFANAYS